MTLSICPKSVVRFMSNVSDSFAISASAELIFNSASYFWIFWRSSISFSLACWIFFRLLPYAVSCICSCWSLAASSSLAFCSSNANFAAVARSPALRYALVSASSFCTCERFAETWRVTRSTSPRYCSSPSRPSFSCSTARSYSYCICAIGSASQKRFATLLICATKADQNLWRITASPLTRTTWLPLDRFPFGAAWRFGEDLALVHLVQRFTELQAGARAQDVTADFLEKRKLFRARIERDEVDLDRSFALAEDIARDLVGASAARVLAVSDDQQVLAEDAGAIEIRPCGPQRLADRGTAAGTRQATECLANRRSIVGANGHEQPDVAGKAVEADLDRKVGTLRDERLGGVEHRFERLLSELVFGPRIARRVLAHRARGVDENRHGGTEALLDVRRVRGGGLKIARGAAIGSPVPPAVGLARNRRDHAWNHDCRGQPCGAGRRRTACHANQLRQYPTRARIFAKLQSEVRRRALRYGVTAFATLRLAGLASRSPLVYVAGFAGLPSRSPLVYL